jgi:hypothetical protein
LRRLPLTTTRESTPHQRAYSPAKRRPRRSLRSVSRNWVGDKADPDDYLWTATVAEVQLLQGNIDAAAGLYSAAVLAAPLDYGSHEDSFAQAQLLLSALDATYEQRAKINAAFPTIKQAVHRSP